MSETLMSATGLSKTYRLKGKPVIALTEVSLSVQPGEFVAIVGRSGSGKSTLLSLIGGLDQPDSGEVCFDAIRLNQLTQAQAAIFRRETIGYLFQSIDLLPSLTALENVALPAALQGTDVAKYRPEAAKLLAAVGLSEKASALPDQLSGGERQRVGIARALINHPRLILADEPTGSLDQATGEAIITLLKQTAEAQQIALIIVTHDLEIAAQADRVIHLSDGRMEV
ncbi:MAG: ATP-binding cassette domain-containing protein [Chloroflexi bacterium]|nr:ATP-binding cassette domain-containing protein [Chloroflexota bacterium]